MPVTVSTNLCSGMCVYVCGLGPGGMVWVWLWDLGAWHGVGVAWGHGMVWVWPWDLGAWHGVGVAMGPGGMAWCGCGHGTWGHGMVWVWPWDLGAWHGVPIVGTKHKPADSSRLLWFPLLRTLLSSYITAFKLRDLIHV